MGKDKNKQKNKGKLLQFEVSKNCKTSCCEKYKKAEKKRCTRCPMFDLNKKAC